MTPNLGPHPSLMGNGLGETVEMEMAETADSEMVEVAETASRYDGNNRN